jgi:hypothetical protein
MRDRRNVIAFDNDVSDVDAYAKLDALRRRIKSPPDSKRLIRMVGPLRDGPFPL